MLYCITFALVLFLSDSYQLKQKDFHLQIVFSQRNDLIYNYARKFCTCLCYAITLNSLKSIPIVGFLYDDLFLCKFHSTASCVS